jgi:hypothetical protein
LTLSGDLHLWKRKCSYFSKAETFITQFKHTHFVFGSKAWWCRTGRGISGNLPIVDCIWCVTNVLKTSSESYCGLSFACMGSR